MFDKLAMSAFAGTPLEMALRDLGIRAFAIAGVALEVRIAPTVWQAVDLGLIPVVVTDTCGGRDQPAMQRVLDNFRFSGDAHAHQYRDHHAATGRQPPREPGP